MPSDPLDQRRRITEQRFDVRETADDTGHLEVARNLARAVAAQRDVTREADANLESAIRVMWSTLNPESNIPESVIRGVADFMRDFKDRYDEDSPEAGNQGDDQAQQSMFEDIDAILTRVESGITGERTAMNTLLDRLRDSA
jgi:hypothetical protein